MINGRWLEGNIINKRWYAIIEFTNIGTTINNKVTWFKLNIAKKIFSPNLEKIPGRDKYMIYRELVMIWVDFVV